MRCQLLTVLATLAATALGDVQFTEPAAGASIVGGSPMTITWTDDGSSPTIDQFKTYTLNIMAGGNTAATSQSLVTVTANGVHSGPKGSVAFAVPVGVGETSTNAYFLQMISIGIDGGQDIVYSSRFGLTDMTGTFSPALSTGIEAIASLTDVPAAVHGLAEAAPTGATSAPAAVDQPWAIPYHLQTGLIKYAPPQPVPGTKITAKTTSVLNPSTSFTIFKTYAPPASITFTATAAQTFHVSSRENTVAAAAMPTPADMNKYLNRWKD